MPIPGFFIGSRVLEFYSAGFPKCQKIHTVPKHLVIWPGLEIGLDSQNIKSWPAGPCIFRNPDWIDNFQFYEFFHTDRTEEKSARCGFFGPKSVPRTGQGSSSHKSSDQGLDQLQIRTKISIMNRTKNPNDEPKPGPVRMLTTVLSSMTVGMRILNNSVKIYFRQ